jgi:hypothetical protein
MVVLECNEIPLKIFRSYADRHPDSAIADLLNRSVVMQTEAKDVPLRDLYPAQTWASLNTGVPFQQHKIQWYNDPKPSEYPFYWQRIAKAGFTVGMFGTLHSSPAKNFADDERIKFLVPDCFAVDGDAFPSSLGAFQRVTLRQVNANRRVTSKLPVSKDEVELLLRLPGIGLRPKTAAEIASVIGKIALKKINRERLRVVQFLLARDVFFKALRKHDVDLAVFFTNHVAANMHRYWYAMFPEEYEHKLFDDAWVSKYRGEIDYAMSMLSDFVADMMKLCDATGRILVMDSSMGQFANPFIKDVEAEQIVIDSIETLLSRAGLAEGSYEFLSAMEPEYTLRMPSEEAARQAAELLSKMESKELIFDPQQNQDILTIDFVANAKASAYRLGEKEYSLAELGLKRIDVDDGHTGKHHTHGSLIIYNSREAKRGAEVVDYLEFAPAICSHFGADVDDLQEPSFSI